MPMDAIAASKRTLLRTRSVRRSFRFLAPRSGISKNAANAPAVATGRWKGERPGAEPGLSAPREAVEIFWSVAMVRVEVAVPETVGVMLG